MLTDDTFHKSEGALLHLWFVKQMQASLIPFQQISLNLIQPPTVSTVACSVCHRILVAGKTVHPSCSACQNSLWLDTCNTVDKVRQLAGIS